MLYILFDKYFKANHGLMLEYVVVQYKVENFHLKNEAIIGI